MSAGKAMAGGGAAMIVKFWTEMEELIWSCEKRSTKYPRREDAEIYVSLCYKCTTSSRESDKFWFSKWCPMPNTR